MGNSPLNTREPLQQGHWARIGMFISFSGHGGVERMMLNLAEGLASAGCLVDLITVKTSSTYLKSASANIRQVNLGGTHTFSSIFRLSRYLRRERPLALLAAKDRANITAVCARGLSGVKTRLVLRMGTTVSAALEGRRPIKEKFWYTRMRLFYPRANAVVAVSEGVASDLKENAALPASLIRVIHNPVITPRLLSMAEEPLDHPWFKANSVPVIIAAGRLTRQKDFSTLIKAFAKVRDSMACRLVILGEGRDRTKLETLISQLGLRQDTLLPGFVSNPYTYFKNASLFALSSIWEGSPNVLTEALAVGTPVVATDCPHGPREILQNGRFGPLVPVGDVDAMAAAITRTLTHPPEKSFLKTAVRDYTLEQSTSQYLEVLLGSSPRGLAELC